MYVGHLHCGISHSTNIYSYLVLYVEKITNWKSGLHIIISVETGSLGITYHESFHETKKKTLNRAR